MDGQFRRSSREDKCSVVGGGGGGGGVVVAVCYLLYL